MPSPRVIDELLSAPTRAWLACADDDVRKRHGQYFTPAPLADALVARLALEPGERVLDPGVGSGELLRACAARCHGLELVGWDVDASLLDVARELVPDASLVRRDALEPFVGEPYDALVANPPYVELRDRPDLRRRFADAIGGRLNAFALFVRAGLDLVRDGGRLGLVVPSTLLVGAYHEPLRRAILERAAIEHLELVPGDDRFAGVQQTVALLVLRRGASGDAFTFRRPLGGGRERLLFHADPERLRAHFDGRRTLHALGFRAVTGRIVRNRERALLRRRAAPGTVPLVQTHNIERGRVRLDEQHRQPQHCLAPEPLAGPALVLNRITGPVGSGAVRAALIPTGERFVGENHVNVVLPRDDAPQLVPWEGLLDALQDPRVNERVRDLTGNTQLSATELMHLLPLDA